VCRHKAMIFQILCHYWGIPARQVRNASHGFVEISPDGGNTWRQYQLGGGGQSSSNTTEPDWGDYHQSGNSILRPPNTRPTHLQSARQETGRNKIELKKIFEELWKKQSSNGAIEKGDLDRLKALILEELKNTETTEIKLRHFLFLHPYFFQTIASDREITDLLIRLVGHAGMPVDYPMFNCMVLCYVPFTALEDPSIKDQEEYISMLCDMCESNAVFKKFILGALQYKAKAQSDFPCRDRILKMASTISFPDFEVLSLYDNENPDAVDEFIHDLPHSKYLESKIATVSIDRKYTATPNGNSQIVPEKLATGLPAFLSQSTIKESKPVIVDLCINGPKMYQQIQSYIANHADKQTELYKLLELKHVEVYGSDVGSQIGVSEEDIKNAFFTWVAQHKLKTNNEWRWLADEYTTCHSHSSPTVDPPSDYPFSSGRYIPCEQSSEAIRTRFKEPTAIVLKEKDFLIMLDEFLSMV
ncbi:MAG: hypothetical protein ACPG5T_07040, partial [Endozoicomonas sp.]